MKKTKYTPEQQKLIIEAHNNSENGIRLGVQKSQKSRYTETPLFKKENQIKLF
jgi:hypothetical protein